MANDSMEPIVEDINKDEHSIDATKREQDNLEQSSFKSRGFTKMTKTKKKNKSVHDEGKMRVQYSMSGVPYGEEANDLVNNVGVLARVTILIIYKDWRLMPLWMKDEI